MTVGVLSMDGLHYMLLDQIGRRAMLTSDEWNLLQLLACGGAAAGEANCLCGRATTEKRKQA